MEQLITVAVVQVLFLAGVFLWLQRKGIITKLAPAVVPSRMEEAVRLLEHTAQGVIAELEVRIAEARGLLEEWDRRLSTSGSAKETPKRDGGGRTQEAREKVLASFTNRGNGGSEHHQQTSSSDAAARFIQALQEFERAQQTPTRSSSRNGSNGVKPRKAATRSKGRRPSR